MKLEETEEEALWILSSAYEACALSACDPVCVQSDLKTLTKMHIGRKHIFSHMFYDCTEPEKTGRGIMAQRIREAGDDILAHIKTHDGLLVCFDSVGQALNISDRMKFVEGSRTILENLENYGEFIKEHIEKYETKAFLYYPTCLPGHIFAPPHTGVIREKIFNPEQDIGGLRKDIERGFLALDNFPLHGRPLMKKGMHSENVLGNGIIDTSLRGRLGLTKKLLETAGFRLQ